MPGQPTKTSKTGHFRVLRNKSSDTNIFAHAGIAPPDGVLRRTPAQMLQRT